MPTILNTRKCIDCKCDIILKKQRPRCMDCYLKEKNKPTTPEQDLALFINDDD